MGFAQAGWSEAEPRKARPGSLDPGGAHALEKLFLVFLVHVFGKTRHSAPGIIKLIRGKERTCFIVSSESENDLTL